MGVNAIFKEGIGEKKIMFPKRKEYEVKLVPFLEKLEHAMEKALLRPNITSTWKRAFPVHAKATNLLPLREKSPPVYVPKKSTLFSLGGRFVTDA
jgi:hypothetical protein